MSRQVIGENEAKGLVWIVIGIVATFMLLIGGLYLLKITPMDNPETPVIANNFISIERPNHTEILRFRLAEIDADPDILGKKLDSLYNINPELNNAFFVKIVANGQISEMPVLKIKKNIDNGKSRNYNE